MNQFFPNEYMYRIFFYKRVVGGDIQTAHTQAEKSKVSFFFFLFCGESPLHMIGVQPNCHPNG